MEKKKNIFFVSEIKASESVAIICLYYEENTHYQKSMVWETVLLFSISLRGTFSTWIGFTGINKYVKGAVVQLCTVYRPDYDATCGGVLWNGTFLDIYLTMFFLVRNLKNTFKLWGWYFFRKCSKLNLNLQNGKEKFRKYILILR